MKTTSEKVAKLLLKINAITLNPKKPYRFTSGVLSPVYTDCRVLMGHPKERKIIRNLYIELMRNSSKNFNLVAGTATAGIPHAAWIAEKLNLPMVYVREKAKDHGKENLIEGFVKKGQRAAVIEDLISTGGSSAQTANAIREAGGKAADVFAIITHGMKKSEENFKSNKLQLTAMTSFKDVVAAALKMGQIKKEEAEIVLDWISDPPTWGKRNGFE